MERINVEFIGSLEYRPAWGDRIDGSKVKFWATKKAAQEGAAAIGWPVSLNILRVWTRFQAGWAIGGEGGFLSKKSYNALLADRQRSIQT